MNDSKITGALFDFIGFLTTHPKKCITGSHYTVYGIMDRLSEWAKNRDFDLENPDIMNWNEDDKNLREQYPELQKLYEKKCKIETEYYLLRKLLDDHQI